MNSLTKKERDTLEDLFLEISHNTEGKHSALSTFARWVQTIVIYLKGMRF